MGNVPPALERLIGPGKGIGPAKSGGCTAAGSDRVTLPRNLASSFIVAKNLNGYHRYAPDRHRELKRLLHRVVSMLTRLIAISDTVFESPAEYNAGIDDEYRDAAYKYDLERKPEQWVSTQDVN